jgi:hypothetical protein
LLRIFSVGLFHGAILMSGNELRIQGLNSPESHPENYIKVVAAQHDCPTDDNWQMMDCLRDVGARDLQATGFDCTVNDIKSLVVKNYAFFSKKICT